MSRFTPYAGRNPDQARRRARKPRERHNIQLQEATDAMTRSIRAWREATTALEADRNGDDVEFVESIGVSVHTVNAMLWQLTTLLAMNLKAVNPPELAELLDRLQQITDASQGPLHRTLIARMAWCHKALEAIRGAAESSFAPHGDN